MVENIEKLSAAGKRVSHQENVVEQMKPDDPALPAARRLLDLSKKLASKVPRVLVLKRDRHR